MIKIYGKSGCTWCERAVKLAKRYDLQYEYLDIGDKNNLDEMKHLVPDVHSVPQIFWGNKYLGGYAGFAREIENTVGGYGKQLF